GAERLRKAFERSQHSWQAEPGAQPQQDDDRRQRQKHRLVAQKQPQRRLVRLQDQPAEGVLLDRPQPLAEHPITERSSDRRREDGQQRQTQRQTRGKRVPPQEPARQPQQDRQRRRPGNAGYPPELARG